MSYRFSRRALLASSGLAAGMLPLLNARKGYAATPAFPKRLIVIQWPNGVVHNPTNGHPGFWPKGDENNFTIDSSATSVLAPLIPHQKDILIVGGLELRHVIGQGHGSFPQLLTGAPGAPSNAPINPDGVKSTGSTASVDQVIGEEIEKKTPLPFRTLALCVGAPDRNSGFTFRGGPIGGAANAPTLEHDPVRLYDSLFAQLKPGPVEPVNMSLLQKSQRRKAILEHVGKRLTAMSQRLGSEDKQKIERHMQSIKELEAQLKGMTGGGGAACTPPGRPDPTKDYAVGEYTNPANPIVPDIQKLQMDMVVAAMSCNLTRVATLQWQSSHNNTYVFFWLGLADVSRDSDTGGYRGQYRQHHEIAHNQGLDADHTRQKNMVDRWFFSQFAYLIQKLKDTPEGDGTMLDNTVVLFANNMADGPSHSVSDLPWVMAGSCGGYFKTGRYLRYAGGQGTRIVPHNGLLVSLCNAMDVPRETFGDPSLGGPLASLRG